MLLAAGSVLRRRSLFAPNQFRSLDLFKVLIVLPDENSHGLSTSAAKEHVDTKGGVKEMQLVFEIPREWYSKNIPESIKRESMVDRLNEWSKRRVMTAPLFVKLIKDPFSPSMLGQYTSKQIARIVFSIGNLKKGNKLETDEDKIKQFLRLLWKEATDRRKLMTYDDISLAQAAYGFSLLQLNDPNILKPFADEAVKPHRIRNSRGKTLVHLLESLKNAKYDNTAQVAVLSQAAVDHLTVLPTHSLPKLLISWSYLGYDDQDHINRVLEEALRPERSETLLVSHLEDVLHACTKLELKDKSIVTKYVRELIYSRKWHFLTAGSLARIVWYMGDLRHEVPSHWSQILTAVLDKERSENLECNAIVDLFVGWSKVSFRNSRLLEELSEVAIRGDRLDKYSTKQLFEIFRAQRELGLMKGEYVQPIVGKLDEDKILKCDLETRIRIFLYPKIKSFVGMKSVASIAKSIFKSDFLEIWEIEVLLRLAEGLVMFGPKGGLCFEEILKVVLSPERRQELTPTRAIQLLKVWNYLEYKDEYSLAVIVDTCSENLPDLTDADLLKLACLLVQVSSSSSMHRLQPFVRELATRPISVFTTKGLKRIMFCFAKSGCMNQDELAAFSKRLRREVSLKNDEEREALSESLSELGLSQDDCLLINEPS